MVYFLKVFLESGNAAFNTHVLVSYFLLSFILYLRQLLKIIHLTHEFKHKQYLTTAKSNKYLIVNKHTVRQYFLQILSILSLSHPIQTNQPNQANKNIINKANIQNSYMQLKKHSSTVMISFKKRKEKDKTKFHLTYIQTYILTYS